jgi:O-acetylhomoserine/O-acetylserine sulfhydrylase-like pyridoxal-dependent enzyme
LLWVVVFGEVLVRKSTVALLYMVRVLKIGADLVLQSGTDMLTLKHGTTIPYLRSSFGNSWSNN